MTGPEITNQTFVREGVRMIRCWDSRGMTEMIDPHPPKPQMKSYLWQVPTPDGLSNRERYYERK